MTKPQGAEHRLARTQRGKGAWVSAMYALIIFLFLYAPMVVMVVISFNGKNSIVEMDGFSFRWYKEFAENRALMTGLRNTLILALCASGAATLIGTAAAIALDAWKKSLTRSALMVVTDIPMMAPDIVTGISMMLMFVLFGTIVGNGGSLGFGTLLIAHITFCVPYVILSVLPRLRQMDPHLAEAAMDLGCTPFAAFRRVVLPNITSSIVTGALMAFTLSLDDFVISHFTTSGSFNTLPLEIYSITRKPVRPSIFALSTLIFVGIFLLLLLINFAQSRAERKTIR
ncbi:MAG: ABC transporter permease [Oscillospiraceae bacterium]|jgi:spermidine/putrescine transport system permease protein|nr:ABC transporter permease [Oscillospiraceae bacterium]